jgi:hypothetical protein
MNLAGPLSSKVALSGSVIMSHSYNDISLFVSCFNISVSLDNLFQRARKSTILYSHLPRALGVPWLFNYST